MAAIKEKSSDRVLLAYEEELRRYALGEGSQALDTLLANRPELEQELDHLNQEFCSLFCENHPDPSPQEMEQALSEIQLDGKPFPFLADPAALAGSLRDSGKYAAAYAMLKIRDQVLYQDQPDPSKGNVVFMREGKPIALKREEGVLTAPEAPQEMGRWKSFANKVFGAYQKEQDEYEAKRLRYEEQKRAYDRQQLEKEARSQYKNQRRREGERTRIPLSQLADEMKGLESRLKEEDPWWHVNSRQYKEFRNALKEVNRLWNVRDTPQGRLQMSQAYEKLGQAGNAYLREHSGSHATNLGRLRVQMVRKVMELQQKDSQFLAVEQERGRSLQAGSIGDWMGDGRRLRLTEGDTPLSTVGAATSVRFQVGPENGLDHRKGFFTADKEKVESLERMILPAEGEEREAWNRLPQSAARKLKDHIQGMELAEKLLEKRSSREFMDIFRRLPQYSQEKEAAWEEVAASLEFAVMRRETENKSLKVTDVTEALEDCSSLEKESKEGIKDSCRKYLFARMLIRESGDPEQCISKINSLVPKMDKEAFSKDEAKAVTGYINGISKELHAFVIAGIAQIPLERRTVLNERNVASSVMADLLGCPDVIARSESARLTLKDGTVREGMFMDFAEGLPGGSFRGTDIQEREYTSLLENGNFKRQVADLQALDCICGQIDRHMNNVMFQVDPQSGAVTGFKGIDNDMSFGISGTSTKGYHSVPMGLIRTVSQEMADALEALSPEVVDYRLQHLLSEPERKALWERIDTFRQWVRSDQVEKVQKDQWGSKKWEDMAMGYTGTAETPGKNNLFYKVGDAILGKEAGEIRRRGNERLLGLSEREEQDRRAYRNQVDQKVHEGFRFERESRQSREQTARFGREEETSRKAKKPQAVGLGK